MTTSIRPLVSIADAEWCAELMATSEPWLTLGRTYKAGLQMVQDPTREVYVAEESVARVGFLILFLAGPLAGYIQTVAVTAPSRGQGIGAQLITFAERRIATASPNVFLCVSSFNTDARRFYERAGYALIGTLTSYLSAGHDELLFRKSIGPWDKFIAQSP